MLISEDPRELYLWKERFAEILSHLTPDEKVIVGLCLEGLTDEQVAAVRGVNRSAITHRLLRARRRIVQKMPEMAVYLEGRRRRTERRNRPSPLTLGWTSRWEGEREEPQREPLFAPQLIVEIDLASRLELTLGIERQAGKERVPQVELTLRLRLAPGLDLVLWIEQSP
jgi:hypothetical protein